jgi:hypothetical protein
MPLKLRPTLQCSNRSSGWKKKPGRQSKIGPNPNLCPRTLFEGALMLVRSREALRCFPFLHRCHTIGPRHRFRLCQTQEAHISADGFARDGRRWAPASARRTGQNWARRSKEKQHHQCDLHRASPSVLRVQWTLLVHARLNTSNGTSLNVAGREGLAAVHRRAVSHRKCEPDRAASMLRVFLARTPLPWAKSPPS